MGTDLNLPDGLKPYEVLHLPAFSSSREIKRAYKKLALKLHPDKNPNDPKADKKFHSLQIAYEYLMDSRSKARYDAHLKAQEAKQKRYEEQDQSKKIFADKLKAKEQHAKSKKAATHDAAPQETPAERLKRMRRANAEFLKKQSEEQRTEQPVATAVEVTLTWDEVPGAASRTDIHGRILHDFASFGVTSVTGVDEKQKIAFLNLHSQADALSAAVQFNRAAGGIWRVQIGRHPKTPAPAPSHAVGSAWSPAEFEDMEARIMARMAKAAKATTT